MRNRMAVLIALSVLTAACGSKKEGPGIAPTDTPGGTSGEQKPLKSIYELPGCTGDIRKVLGTINIVLPKTLEGTHIKRLVNAGKAIDAKDPRTGEDDVDFKRNKEGANEPFDVFINGPSYADKTGYLMVRVLLTRPANFAFWNQGGFHGVGASVAGTKLMCGSSQVIAQQETALDKPGGQKPPPDKAELISVFYIDVEQLKGMELGASVPFTIGLIADKGEKGAKTPILIDPKILNDGGGLQIIAGGGNA